MDEELRSTIREYVASSGWDALTVYPRFSNVPGREIQRIIDEEVTKSKERANV
ncbi:hypothetical protein [Paenibacillus sp. NPDC057967]|uniref:hypothetical protein n=1 Tax=Paenibacillus sp. NPDC057967 TaxID=3346293 RepID=UPI0036D82820